MFLKMYFFFFWNGNFIKEGLYGLILFLIRYCINIVVDWKKKYLYIIVVYVLFLIIKFDFRLLRFDFFGLVLKFLLCDIYKNSMCYLLEVLR